MKKLVIVSLFLVSISLWTLDATCASGVDLVTSQRIKKALENDPEAVIQSLDLKDLMLFINAANYLNIQDLMDVSLRNLAERTLSLKDWNIILNELTENLIHQLWEISPVYNWFVDQGFNSTSQESFGIDVTFSPDGRYMASVDYFIKKHSPVLNQVVVKDTYHEFAHVNLQLPFEEFTTSDSRIFFSPDNRYLMIRVDGKRMVNIFDVLHGFARVDTPLTYDDNIVFSPDGRYVISWGDRSKMKIYDMHDSFTCINKGLEQHPWKVTFSFDGRYMFVLNREDKLIIWDVPQGFVQLDSSITKEDINSYWVSPDNRYLVSYDGDDELGIIKIWDMQHGFAQVDKVLKYKGVDGIKFSPDGRYMASLDRDDDEIIKIWDMQHEFVQVDKPLMHKWLAYGVFSPDGRYMISCDRGLGVIKIWDAHRGFVQIDKVLKHQKINKVRFSPDGRYMISCGGKGGGTIQIWDMQRGFVQVGKFLRHRSDDSSYSYRVADLLRTVLSPDGRYMVSCDEESGMKIWDFSLLQYLTQATLPQIRLLVDIYYAQKNYFIVGRTLGFMWLNKLINFVWPSQLSNNWQEAYRSFDPHMKDVIKRLVPQFQNAFVQLDQKAMIHE